MKENKFDEDKFFKEYSKMPRSILGLSGAGEWHILRKTFPELKDKRVLDLGCGFGWHCRYASEKGAKNVIGIDISKKMIIGAKRSNNASNIEYINMPMEDIDFPENSFDVVLSSLAFQYIESFSDICVKISKCLAKGGKFIFSAEHPIYTAEGSQDWYFDSQENRLFWPVDNYFQEGKREAHFLGEKVIKYHKTMTDYIQTLINQGFEIISFEEPVPEEALLEIDETIKDELRRPMMFIISSIKK